jgi:hypothetical protein
MAKRPSIIGALNIVQGEGRPPETEEQGEPVPAPRAKRGGVVHTSIYVPRPAYQKLREIAFTQERKVHDVIMEGIDAVLQRYGHPSIAELKASTKV